MTVRLWSTNMVCWQWASCKRFCCISSSWKLTTAVIWCDSTEFRSSTGGIRWRRAMYLLRWVWRKRWKTTLIYSYSIIIIGLCNRCCKTTWYSITSKSHKSHSKPSISYISFIIMKNQEHLAPFASMSFTGLCILSYLISNSTQKRLWPGNTNSKKVTSVVREKVLKGMLGWLGRWCCVCWVGASKAAMGNSWMTTSVRLWRVW